jgi:hypothetical protein
MTLDHILEIAGLIVAVLVWLFPPDRLQHILGIGVGARGDKHLSDSLAKPSGDAVLKERPNPIKQDYFTVLRPAVSEKQKKFAQYLVKGWIGVLVIIGLADLIVVHLGGVFFWAYLIGFLFLFVASGAESYSVLISENEVVFKTRFDQNGKILPWDKISKITRTKSLPNRLVFIGDGFKLHWDSYVIQEPGQLAAAIRKYLKPDVYSDVEPLLQHIEIQARIRMAEGR